MLHSALNFAVGFFGLPIEGQYQQSVTIEANGVSIYPFLLDESGDLLLCPLVQQHVGPL